MVITKEDILQKFGEELQEIGIFNFADFLSDVAYEDSILNWDIEVHFQQDVFGNDIYCEKLKQFIKDNCKGENFDELLAVVPYGECVRYIYKDEKLEITHQRSKEILPVYQYLGEALINYMNDLFIDAFI